jgi:glycyl-radical enzyme activating protein/glucokinase-like ROK family protein
MTRPFAIGIDVGGTKIAAGLVQRDGTILCRYVTHAHSEKEPETVIAAIEAACGALLEASGVSPSDIEAVGLGFPGNTNGAAGVVLVCSNLPAWAHVPLRDIVASRVGLPVLLDNDCNLAAVGEHRYGGGRGAHNMCYFTLSTGSGIGIIVEDRLYRGHTGTAGELGHVVIAPGGPACTCGKHGCLMAYCSGIGISRMAYERIQAGADTVLRERVPGDGRRISGEVIATAARQGDAVAREILHTAGTYAGIALSMIIQIINPEVIVVGGGLTRMGDLLAAPMLAAMREHTQPELLDSVTIKPWQLGDDLVVIGAAAEVFASAERYQAQFDARASRFIIEKAERARVSSQAIRPPEPLGQAERTRLEQVEGVIFDIQRYSLHDGPGLRTNVFLKGCPLRCDWCANPESQLTRPQLALFARHCIACGQFGEPCPTVWPTDRDASIALDRESAPEFGQRAAVCPTAAMRWLGERRSAGDIIGEVLRDAPFYQGGGGLTLTGGEPTMQPHLAEALLRLAKPECLSTAMETCGHTHWAVLESLLPYLDHVLFDLKHVDGEVHRRYTGVDNTLILSNLRRLAALRAPLTIRLPLIPGFNATRETMRDVAEFVRSLEGPITRIDLLPYHRLGASKYAALGRSYPWSEQPPLDEGDLDDLAGVLVREGLQVNIGG